MKVTRRKPKARDKTDAKNPVGKGNVTGRNRKPWVTMAVFSFLLVDLYLLATLFLFRTGEFGEVIHSWTLGTFGGGIIVPLVFGPTWCLPHPGVPRTLSCRKPGFIGPLPLLCLPWPFGLGRHRTDGALGTRPVGTFLAGTDQTRRTSPGRLAGLEASLP